MAKGGGPWGQQGPVTGCQQQEVEERVPWFGWAETQAHRSSLKPGPPAGGEWTGTLSPPLEVTGAATELQQHKFPSRVVATHPGAYTFHP